MHAMIAALIYAAAIPAWVGIWYWIGGFRLQREERLLLVPYLAAMGFLAANLSPVLLFGEVGDVPYEEGRFSFIQDRALIVVQATASVLIVAVLVYGLTVRKVPVEFICFMLYAFIFLLGVMSPVVWLPIDRPGMFFVLRHLQSVALIYSLFLCVGGVILLLRDIMQAGGVEIDLAKNTDRVV